jgi:hypothetical protein
VSDLLDKITDA